MTVSIHKYQPRKPILHLLPLPYSLAHPLLQRSHLHPLCRYPTHKHRSTLAVNTRLRPLLAVNLVLNLLPFPHRQLQLDRLLLPHHKRLRPHRVTQLQQPPFRPIRQRLLHTRSNHLQVCHSRQDLQFLAFNPYLMIREEELLSGKFRRIALLSEVRSIRVRQRMNSRCSGARRTERELLYQCQRVCPRQPFALQFRYDVLYEVDHFTSLESLGRVAHTSSLLSSFTASSLSSGILSICSMSASIAAILSVTRTLPVCPRDSVASSIQNFSLENG